MISYKELPSLARKFLGVLAFYAVPPYTRRLHEIRGVQFTDPPSVFIGTNVAIDRTYPELVKIGSNVTISSGASIMAHSSPPMSIQNTYKSAEQKEIDIGDNVYIGANAVVLPGVTVGDWSIIGAGAIVTKDVPEYKIVVGNPAEVIGDLRETDPEDVPIGGQ